MTRFRLPRGASHFGASQTQFLALISLRSHTQLIGSLLSAAMLLPSLASAQDKNTQSTQATQSSTPAQTDTQTVEVNGTLRHQDDTAGKQVVTRAAIEQFGDTNLLDLLRRQQGVTVVGKEIRLHGLGSGYTQILINGEKVPAGFSIEDLSPDSIERVEILRTGSVEFSAQAIAGTINFVLRKTSSHASKQLKLGLVDTANHVTPNLSLFMGDKAGIFSYSLNTGFTQEHSENEFLTTTLSNDSQGSNLSLGQNQSHWELGSKRFHFAPSLNWKFSDNDQLKSQSMLVFKSTHIDTLGTETTLHGPASEYQSNAESWQSRGKSLSSDLSWAHRFNAELKLDTSLGLKFSDVSRLETYQGFQAEQQAGNSGNSRADTHPQQLALIRQIDSDTKAQNWNVKGKLIWQAQEQHSLAFGWDGVFLRSDIQRQQSDQLNLTGKVVVPHEGFSVDLPNLAFFAQDEWELNPSLQMILGIRWEGLGIRIKGSSLVDTNKNFNEWNPVFQTLWKVGGSADDQIRLALSRTYKAPDPAAMAPYRMLQVNNNNLTHPDVQGNPNLLPEHASGIDLSYEHALGQDANISVTAFFKRIQNVTLNRMAIENSRWISFAENQGNAQVHGLEVGTTLPASLFMESAPALLMRLNAARNWSHIEQVPGPDNRLADQVPFSGNLAIEYERTPTHQISMNFNFQSGGLLRSSESNSSYSGVTRTLEFASLWQLNKASKLRFALGNALHQDSLLAQYYQTNSSSFCSSLKQSNNNSVKVILEHTL